MSEANNQQHFESLQSGLKILSEVEAQIDDDNARPQVEQARIYLSKASRNVKRKGFSREFSEAMGLISSIAVSHGHDDLAEEALRLGSEYKDE
ncbi:hypothetical protein [Halobacterium salinarum]|uniref:hypothetical protein n=1 Tax=Halobacterium salinarum TaxID=2242 RepID=UPI0025558E14|nr:hypothetical protein [Halobacterium salinarum]MDL0145939.1 hypothetical protein [Halobacterium salinarum]